MLEPSEEWLRKNGDEPFLATYETRSHPTTSTWPPRNATGARSSPKTTQSTATSIASATRTSSSRTSSTSMLGLYEDTVFVIFGDHGEAFGEHGRYQHDNVPYEEGAGGYRCSSTNRGSSRTEQASEPGHSARHPPTVENLLGYEIEGGEYPGSPPRSRCPRTARLCSAAGTRAGACGIKGTEKHIYHFDDRPDELFDLSKDPTESRNLAGERPPEELSNAGANFEWRAKVSSVYTRAAK